MRSRSAAVLALCVLFAMPAARAEPATWDVQLANYAFTPSTLVVAHGDTVRWDWVEGLHSVDDDVTEAAICEQREAPAPSCSITVPGGPAPFILRYHCHVHGPVMSGLVTTDPPPAVTLDAPADDTLTTTPVDVSGSASDNTRVVGVRITWVSVLTGALTWSMDADCTGCGTGSATWHASPLMLPGRYALRATATDDLGLTTSSPPITITVV